MTEEETAKQATKVVGELSAEQAYTVGGAVGSLLPQGMPTDEAHDATITIAAFIKKGMAAQQAVDEILATYAARGESDPA
jgi:hypothetical protein